MKPCLHSLQVQFHRKRLGTIYTRVPHLYKIEIGVEKIVNEGKGAKCAEESKNWL